MTLRPRIQYDRKNCSLYIYIKNSRIKWEIRFSFVLYIVYFIFKIDSLQILEYRRKMFHREFVYLFKLKAKRMLKLFGNANGKEKTCINYLAIFVLINLKSINRHIDNE